MRQRVFLLAVFSVGLLTLTVCGRAVEVVEVETGYSRATAVTPSPLPPIAENHPPATDVPPPINPTTKNETAPTVPESPGEASLAQFYEIVLRDILRRDPEFATGVGLPKEMGLANHDQLTNESAAFTAETYDLLAAHLETLRGYDVTGQSEAQRLSSAILDWYLEDVLRQRPYHFYEYRLSPIFGLPWQFPNLMTTEHPLTSLAEAKAYVSRLNQFKIKADQVVAGLQKAEDQGVLPPRWMLNWTIGEMVETISGSARSTEFYQHFAGSLAELDSIPEAEKDRLLAETETAVSQSVIPGYQKLIDFMRDQVSRADNNGAALHHPDGEAYYQTQLQHHTTTDLTADEVHEIGLAEVARIQTEMRESLAELGYDTDQPLSRLMPQVDGDSGTLRGEAEIVGEYERLIAEAETAVAPYFDTLPETELVVDTVSNGTAYYLTPALDGSRPGIFYAVVGGGPQSRLRLPTTTYHEAIPGHHFQIALQGELDEVPTFRKVFLFTAYTEGWALYAEQLAAEIGLYDDDPHGNLGRLQMELFRAARLVVDTGIHAKGWSRQEAIDYMVENTGLPPQWVQFEVSRYTLWPGQATAYKIGQLKINELRDRAQQELGDAFELREFHNVVLQNGAMPLSVLEMVVLDYIEANR